MRPVSAPVVRPVGRGGDGVTPVLETVAVLALIAILGALAVVDAVRFELARRRMGRVGRRGLR